MNRYINVLTIKILDVKFEINIGNPLWFINEFKDMKRGKNGNK